MLNNIRNNIAHSKKTKVVLSVVAVGFVVWGIGMQDLSLSRNYALKVGSTEISATDYARAYAIAQERIKAQFGGQEVPAELMKLFGVEKQIENSLVSEAALQNYINENKIFIDESIILDLIKQDPKFQKDGKFDKATYTAVLAQYQLSPIEYEKSIIKSVKANLVVNGFVGSTDVSDIELDMQVKHIQERRDIEVLTIADKDITTLPEATEDELTAIYEEMTDSFKVAETRDFNVLVISQEALAKDIKIEDADVKAYFDEHKDEFFTKPEYKVQQILVKDEQTANKVLALADLKTNFNKYVQEYSQDKFSKDKNGDMGWLSGNIFGAEFENFVNTTKKGDVSTTAIKTPFGFHIFKLTDLKPAAEKPFAEVKEKIKANLTAKQAEEMLQEKLDMALDMSSAGEKLKNIADELGFEMQSFTNVKADFPKPYITTVFETDEGEISQPIDLDLNATALVEVTTITPESVKELNEVKEQVVAAYKQEKTNELKQEKANAILETVKSGEVSFKQAAKDNKLATAIKSVVDLARSANQKQQISDEVAAKAFDTKPGSVIATTLNDQEGNVIIVKVTESYQEKISDKDKENIRSELALNKTNELYLSFINALTSDYKVVRNEAVIKQITKNNQAN
jgi:peptidyl-prolyl cis-trans isomerase D